MTPDQARRYVEVLDLYAGELEALVGETRADKPGLTSALNPHLHDMARGVATVREKITADAENMTRMIAGMREEWAREARIMGDPKWYPIRWCRSRAEAELTDWGWSIPMGATVEYRLARRYVTEPEEA